MPEFDIYATGIKEGTAKSLAVRGLRQALVLLDQPSSVGDALDALAEIEDSVARLGTASDSNLRDHVIDILADSGVYAESEEAGKTDTPDEFTPSADFTPDVAHQVTLMILHAVDGNPTHALHIIRAIGRLTGDDLWEDAANVLLTTFPAKPIVNIIP